MKGHVPLPKFSSQIKDSLQSPPKSFFSDYKFSADDLQKIWSVLAERITDVFLEKTEEKKKKRVVRGRVDVPKSTDAKFAGDKSKWKDCSLFICEGDSAMGLIHNAIVNRDTGLGGYNYYGTYSIQGVPMNARKQITMTKHGKMHRTEKLKNNERLESLVKIVGLDYAKEYTIDDKEGMLNLNH